MDTVLRWECTVRTDRTDDWEGDVLSISMPDNLFSSDEGEPSEGKSNNIPRGLSSIGGILPASDRREVRFSPSVSLLAVAVIVEGRWRVLVSVVEPLLDDVTDPRLLTFPLCSYEGGDANTSMSNLSASS